jgi:energy-coupling factor transport system permease protein
MHRAQEQVREFHREVIGQESPQGPQMPAETKLRAMLILEEAMETAAALCGADQLPGLVTEQMRRVLESAARSRKVLPDLAEAVDGCCDLLYVTYGTLDRMGLDTEPFFDEVHRANMEKRDPIGAQRSSCSPVEKVLKPEGWRPPDVEGILRRLQDRAAADALATDAQDIGEY